MNQGVEKLRSAFERYQQGDAVAAIEMIEALLRKKPEQLDALVLAGQIHHAQGNHKKAVFYLEKALQQRPGHVTLTANLAASHLALGQPEIAEALSRSAVLARPKHFGARLNLGLALFAQRKYRSSAVELSIAWQQRPDNLIALKHLAHALQRSRGPYFEVRGMLERVLARSPGDQETLAMLADAYIQNGETDAGLDVFEKLLASDLGTPVGDASRYHSSYLLALQYQQQTGPGDLLNASRQWADRYGQSQVAKPPPHGGKTLRIGWISPRFTGGPVACFLLAVLEAFDSSACEHYLYAARSHEGSIKDSFKQLSDTWRELDGQSTDEAAQIIASDKLDILVDLAGHSPGGMLTTLCKRPAAVQVSWLDSFCTTGLTHFDAFLSDWYLSPSGSEEYFTEALLRLKPGRLCYRPQEPVALRPRTPDADGIVFASFNRLSKLGDDVLRAWAEILNAVPGSRLVLRNTMFNDSDVCAAFYRRSERLGLQSGRVSLLGYCDYAEIMASYADVDIVLDPFPFSGCTTTCDALWMGVPVITRTGSTLVSRQSGAILDALDLQDLIADSTHGYISSAVKLARDESRRSELRSGLRERMKIIFDPQTFASGLLKHFRRLAGR